MVLIFSLILTTFGISFICWIDDKKLHLKCVLRHENCKFLSFKFSKVMEQRA